MDSRFSCNICFEPVEEPVVTQCGHLYCWPCLFRWLEPGMTWTERQSLGLPASATANVWMETAAASQSQQQQQQDVSRRQCPVCKSACVVSNLIPIYVRNESCTTTKEETVEDDQRKKAAAAAEDTKKTKQLEKESSHPDRSTESHEIKHGQNHERNTAEHSGTVQDDAFFYTNNMDRETPAAAATAAINDDLHRHARTRHENDDKHSASSTIATEQEEEDDDEEDENDLFSGRGTTTTPVASVTARSPLVHAAATTVVGGINNEDAVTGNPLSEPAFHSHPKSALEGTAVEEITHGGRPVESFSSNHEAGNPNIDPWTNTTIAPLSALQEHRERQKNEHPHHDDQENQPLHQTSFTSEAETATATNVTTSTNTIGAAAIADSNSSQLRQRRRPQPQQQQPQPPPPLSTLMVPSRPSPFSTRQRQQQLQDQQNLQQQGQEQQQHRRRSFSENAVQIYQGSGGDHPLNSHSTIHRTLAISQGLAITLHRALQPTAASTSAAPGEPSPVPRLHRPQGYGNAAAAAMNSILSQQQQERDQMAASDPDAMEFLSRILLMLASFVILCLLLF